MIKFDVKPIFLFFCFLSTLKVEIRNKDGDQDQDRGYSDPSNLNQWISKGYIFNTKYVDLDICRRILICSTLWCDILFIIFSNKCVDLFFMYTELFQNQGRLTKMEC